MGAYLKNREDKSLKRKKPTGVGIYSGRRQIVWRNIRGIRSISAFLVATALGAGLMPLAPGTMGTLVGIPLAYCTTEWSLLSRLALWLGVTVLGTWSATRFDQMMKTHDNQNIVIDEVVGLGITAWTAGDDALTWLVAFLLFRFFDVLKPPPVRQVDSWSKKQTDPIWDGVGVMADDVIAGFQGLAVILILQWLQIL